MSSFKIYYYLTYFLKKYGTMCCIVPNNTISLFYQIKERMKKLVLNGVFLFGLGLLYDNMIAQEVKMPESLYREIAHMDSVLFNAFNNRDM